MESNKHIPPTFAQRFLKWFLREELAEEVLGDLEEQFFDRLDQVSPFQARLNYWYQVFNYLRPFAIRLSLPSFQNNYAMFKNYYTIAWRNLFKYKMYSIIKIGGFAIGVAACLLIALYMREELSYDKHYEDGEQIFRLINTDTRQGNVDKWPAFQAPIAEVMRNDFPEVQKVGRMIPFDWYDAGNNQVRQEDKQQNLYEEGFIYADQEWIEILQIPMIYGERTKALSEPNTMLISKRKADKYFPGENPVGKTLILNENKERPYIIGGVMENFPTTSHIQSDFILTLTGVEFWNGEQTSWCCSNYTVYVQLYAGTNVDAFEDKLSIIRDNYMVPYQISQNNAGVEDTKNHRNFEAQPVGDIHLKSQGIYDVYPRGDINFVWMFGAIAFFILLLACINFINLSTAKSANRAKEVGLRKVVGSYRGHLIQQFLSESLLFSLISFVLGILFAIILLPFFNDLAGKSMRIPWAEAWFVPILVGGIVLVGIIAGLYPAFYLSRFQPVDVLKGSLSRGSKGGGLRSVLVVFQFTTSIILIVGAFVVHRQMGFILNKKLGYDKEQVIMVQGTNTLDGKFPTFKNELLQLPEVAQVSISNYLPVTGTKRDMNTFWKEGMSQIEKGIGAEIWRVDPDYISTMGMKLVAGRTFSNEIASDSSAMIISQKMAEKMGFKDPIGQQIVNGFSPTFHVIGVVEDFHFESIREEIIPLCFARGNYGSIVPVKVNTTDMTAALASITKVWDELMPNQPIRYSFLDDKYAMMYADVQRTGQIFTIFAILAIFVACLGLFALSAFMVEQRRKEVSIRKVLGASFGNLFQILTTDFIKLVLISLLIAIPMGWYMMNWWLEDFSYQIDITWDVFAISGLGTLLIALLTISYESIRLIWGDPSKNLRSE